MYNNLRHAAYLISVIEKLYEILWTYFFLSVEQKQYLPHSMVVGAPLLMMWIQF